MNFDSKIKISECNTIIRRPMLSISARGQYWVIKHKNVHWVHDSVVLWKDYEEGDNHDNKCS